MTAVALITGGHHGLGLDLAEALALAGYRIAVVGETPPDQPVVEHALSRLGEEARYFRHDFRDATAAAALFDAVERDMAPVTTYVTAADIPVRHRGDLLEIEAEIFDPALDVLLRGGFHLAQAVARGMAGRSSRQYRSMIFVTSVSAGMASAERSENSILMAGVAMMAQVFAVRMAPLGIGVFELRPGLIETAFPPGQRDRFTARIEGGLVPAARWGQAADVASVAVAIAEGRLGFSTGAVIPVDGGLSIARL
ncbi:MAG: SDR family oxidoreductase [Tabrizicola sp.]|nr:SDR family oxidoreductase [Tabrizicola sp.]